MRFKYLRDPLFLLCAFTYVINRFILKRLWEDGFVHDHVNDLICIPFVIPIMLFAQRKLRMRHHDEVPLAHEILILIVVLSIVFEILLPLQTDVAHPAIADHMDVFHYVLGGLLASMIWRYWYREADVRPVS